MVWTELRFSGRNWEKQPWGEPGKIRECKMGAESDGGEDPQAALHGMIIWSKRALVQDESLPAPPHPAPLSNMNPSTADHVLKSRKGDQRASGSASTMEPLLSCPPMGYERMHRTRHIQHGCEERELNTDMVQRKGKLFMLYESK